METSNIKNYAPKARVAFMDAVAKRLNTFGISINKKGELQVVDALVQGSVLQIGDNNFDSKLAPARQRLVEKSEQLGYTQLVEQVAYTWFNRLCAIRYMEIHDYLGHGFRVLSHPNGDKRFEILDHAQDAAEDLGLDRDRIIDLMLAGDKNEELYRELLLGQCHKLHEAMPFLFESLNDETELLLPDNLTRTDSILRGLVDSIPEEDWQQVEVIGWLYQFYISEKKDEVIGKVVKSEDIPAATQLFTPNWIVKYMVQNSLGAQWLATYPESPLKEQMEYYIEPAEQTDEVNAQLKAITPSELNPEELTLIDPASGSGHILVEVYDLFKAIYLERGYRQREIAQLILENNLFGLDIDQRAAQLTGFALMMKGREDDRRLFERGVKLNVMAMVDSTSLDVDTLVHGIDLAQHDLTAEDLTALKDLFEHATTFGSLIQVPQLLAEKLPALKQLSETNSQDMFVKEVLEHLTPLVMQAEILAAQYDTVVANPPYMGTKGMNALVKSFAKEYFPEVKLDLFACFIERGYTLGWNGAYIAMVTMQSWMFLSSFEKLRKRMLREKTIKTLTQIGYNSFPTLNSKVAQATVFSLINNACRDYRGCFIDLNAGPKSGDKEAVFLTFNPTNRFEVSAHDLSKIPGMPIAYSAGDSLVQIFSSSESVREKCKPRTGLNTGNNDKFLKEWFELSFSAISFGCSSSDDARSSGKKWFPYNKGGPFRKWYGNNSLVVNWLDDGREIKELAVDRNNGKHWSRFIQNTSYFFQPGLTWSFINYNFGARVKPSGFIFDVQGTSAFPVSSEVNWYAGLLCSKVAQRCLELLNPTLSFQAGNIASIPVIQNGTEGTDAIVSRVVSTAKKDWDSFETSWDFQSLPIFAACTDLNPTLESSYNAWISQNQVAIAEMQRLEEENNRIFIDAYGLQDELTPEVPIEQITLTVNPAYRYGIKGSEEERNARFRSDTMTELVSYTIGCMMGRYSLDQEGLVYAHAGNKGFDTSLYKTFPADSDGIIPILDDEWFKDDACNRVVEFVKTVWGEDNLTENLQFIAESLSLDAITARKSETSVETIRRYLSTKFYKDHMQTYKNRPIYWLFSSGKEKAFECLVYLHRYNEGTLSRMRTEYVTPLLGKYEAYAQQLDKQKEMAESTQDKKRFEKDLKSINKKHSELREFDDKLKHYADMRISIDLDDGVKENYGKFGDLLSDVKKITGKKPEIVNAN
uniref:BREX-1 system adenine-specific DNA-methyltransferase PglX n=1 Tax=uncultured Psychrobacter sp. TaxID=259303 RepID=UPI0025997299|nr:BREX-1 system adenine-specific DNA-methyltransferase PglX [uncultured Psychrobacter sp.]